MRRAIALMRFADPAAIDRAAWPRDIRLFRVVAPPEGVPYRPPSDPDPYRSAGAYDLVAIDDTGAARWPDMPDLLTLHAYRVEADTMFARKPIGDDAEAITLLGRLMFHADLPDSAARRSWRLHAPLAERVHVGASHYVQNWVTETLSSDAPPTRGLPEMRFPNEQALVERFFDSDRGRDEILQDTSHFVASGPRLYLRAI